MLKQKKVKDKNIQKINENLLDSFLIRKADESLAGFGKDVWKIYCSTTLKLVCYINSEHKLYFPCTIEYKHLEMLIEFIKSYNLGNIKNEAV